MFLHDLINLTDLQLLKRAILTWREEERENDTLGLHCILLPSCTIVCAISHQLLLRVFHHMQLESLIS